MSESEWETWVSSVIRNPATKGVGIGMVCSGTDEILKQKYLNKIGINCGYTVLKSDLKIFMKELLEILKAADAKGRRKFIRITMENDTNARVNLPVKGTYVNGIIRDISVVGFSCVLEEGVELTKNTLFQNMQLKLGAIILNAEGIVFGSRMEGDEIAHVILFTQRIDPDARIRIRMYIQSTMQTKLDAELKAVETNQ
jgi:hypothetical protein